MGNTLKKSRFVERSERFDYTFKVKASTFGCNLYFNLQTKNVSSTGFLTRARMDIVPFQVNTILEIILDPQCDYFDKSVPCIGSVSRLDVVEENGIVFKEIGIRITEIEELDFQRWNESLIDLKSKVEKEKQKSKLETV